MGWVDSGPHYKSIQCVGFQSRNRTRSVFIGVYSPETNIRVFVLNEPFVSTEGAGPPPQFVQL